MLKVLAFAALALVAGTKSGRGQTYYVTNAMASGTGSLWDAITQANGGLYNVIELSSGLGPILGTSQMFVNANVTINGNGNVVDMGNQDRAFFVAGGTVNFNDLTIKNGKAQGGAGADGGGGGMGAGGGIFVANGAGINGSNVTLATNVTLSNVSFLSNSAVGGGGAFTGTNGTRGGGGGMGGAGGPGGLFVDLDDASKSGGGGGGFGVGANGGSGQNDGQVGSNGGFLTVEMESGAGGYDGAAGGTQGGGGGGGNMGRIFQGGGGGGGVGGGTTGGDTGGNGGFGGGGGGGFPPGNGGFGGGGGGGYVFAASGGVGGFGGGGGGIYESPGTSVSGGFGGGASGWAGPSGLGGGGAGLGGAIFVMKGAVLTISEGTTNNFSGNSVAGGTGGVGDINSISAHSGSAGMGSAYGADIFLGESVTFNVSGSMAIGNLGGAGNHSDPNVFSAADAQGGIIKQGNGTLVLTGTNYYSGTTIINSGGLKLAAGANEQGTQGVVVGQNRGDLALLTLENGSKLSMSGTTGKVLTVGQNAGSWGTVLVGTGGTGVELGFDAISGGAGGGLVVFDDMDGVSGQGPYSVNLNLEGNLTVEVSGSSVTIFSPSEGNTYTGGTLISSGTLQLAEGAAGQGALPEGQAVTVSAGAALDLGGQSVNLAEFNLNGGVLVDLSNTQAGNLSATSIISSSGSILVEIEQCESFVQTGPGVTVLTQNNSYTGSTVINSGTLALAAGAAEQGTTSVVVGQNAGDNGTLLLGDGSTLNMSGTAQGITLGQSAGSTGTVVISTGGAGVVLGLATINGGTGGGTVIFDELNGVTGTGAYPMYSNLTGNLSVVQNGSGKTILSPFAAYGANTYTGGTTINAGVLQVGSGSGIAQGLPTGGAVTVNGGMLDMNGQTVTVGALQVNGGNVGDSLGGGTLSAASIATQSGTIGVRVSGSGALVQSGTGTTMLSGSNSYSGGTTITGGALQVSNNQGLGSGGVQVSGGSLGVFGGTAIANQVTLSGGGYAVAVNAGGGYAGMADATSNFSNGRSTGASLLAGTSGTGATLKTSFAASSGALNDGERVSDVYSFKGTGGDLFVLELSMSSVEAESVLGWLNLGTNEWENAVNGNVNPTANEEQQGFAGSFATFQGTYGTNISDYVGAYGVDDSGGNVWAVLNHNGDFAVLVVPEPGSAGLFLGAAASLCWVRGRKRQGGRMRMGVDKK